MADAPDPLKAIESPAPQVSVDEVSRLVDEQYGLRGAVVMLVSERDQNFQLTTEHQQRYIIKIANAAEEEMVTDFQIQALQHVDRVGCRVAVPRVIPTLTGAAATAVTSGGCKHVMRVVSYLSGRPLEQITLDTDIARQLGSCLAEVGIALRGFRHPGESHSLLWDIRHAGELRNLTAHIRDGELRDVIHECLDDFENRVTSRLAALRCQVIHNDLNPGNVLVTENGRVSIAGVIDFGDMIRAPLIIDVAVAASYMRSDDDTAALLASLVAGYNEVTRLEGLELELLYDLVRTRLATTISILHWRLAARAADDAYTVKMQHGGASASRFLARINALGRDEFTDRIRPHSGH